jgi:hypothetical protein
MKKNRILYLTVSVVAIAMMAFLSRCGKHEESATSINRKILSSHDWKLQSLTVDGVDKTSMYPGMTLSFTATSYSSSNGTPVWPQIGTWSFPGGTDATTILRDDQIEVHVDQIRDDHLELSLTWNKDTFGSGRTSSIRGRHTYVLGK